MSNSCFNFFSYGGAFDLIGLTVAYLFSAIVVANRLYIQWKTDNGIDAFTRDRHVIFPFHVKILALLMLTELHHSLISVVCYYLISTDHMKQGGINYAFLNGFAMGIDNVVIRTSHFNFSFPFLSNSTSF